MKKIMVVFLIVFFMGMGKTPLNSQTSILSLLVSTQCANRNALSVSDLTQTIEETLKTYGLYSKSAVNLLVGTAIQESRHGLYLRQFKGGPALGLYQIEPITFRWLQEKYPEYLGGRLFEELEYDHRLSTLTARLRYWVVPEPLPEEDDVLGLGLYWKKYFNTELGRGSVEKFVREYRELVLGGRVKGR